MEVIATNMTEAVSQSSADGAAVAKAEEGSNNQKVAELETELGKCLSLWFRTFFESCSLFGL